MNYKNSIVDNLNRLQDKWDAPLKYDNTLFERLKCKFPGSEHIKENYSQCYQDMFVLTMLNGKNKGYYLEIGCGDPFYGNNTALLEKQFNWTGISIDKDIEWKSRKTTPLCFDATKLDYDKLPLRNYDYLQIDCDEASLDVLFKIPFWNRKFSVITFEHDDYRDETDSVKKRSREYLKSWGYVLVVGDVAPNDYNSFEDWYVHPDYVKKEIYQPFMSNKVIRADRIFINNV